MLEQRSNTDRAAEDPSGCWRPIGALAGELTRLSIEQRRLRERLPAPALAWAAE
ncbi:hypothetical protein ruthe_01620 [Rubellimicrobium thermophilum DSM 16684]|uniref:Uncharacterized protein n=1 Tax=Rubellimicrobium thermophilum DSM 16684 TaxID=1123069 RepID=S9SHT0_9RHOB|nr:hypothetical protein [Rubellimicrobium thermophilum]EPX85899.1 hypothetical protein ruthe_01620 [Rubellimicrobium thermophilum DSM 16684]